ncbi:MAG: hypothetical protein WA871_10460 [Candidatus Acidiferrales bacterium]
MSPSNKSNGERAGLGLILCIALLMFFAPLVSLHGAFVGDETANGPNLGARLTTLRSAFNVSSSAFARGHAAAATSAAEHTPSSVPLNVPESLRLEWLASILIFAALACAALALLSLFLFRKATAALSLAGGCLGALAILQLFAMNAGVRSWTSDLIESGLLGSSQDPFVAMRMLMARSFQLDPGIGLYVMTTCLFFAGALAFSRVIPRMESVVRGSPRIQIAEPIQIRPVDTRYAEESLTTLDVSNHGVYFVTARQHYYPGMELRLTRGSRGSDAVNHEDRGSVVQVRPVEGGKFGIAVRLISPPAPDSVL